MEISALLAIFFASLVLIGFLAGIERAFISVNKLSIELSKKQGKYSGKIWGKFIEKPTRFIGTILIAINIMLVAYGLLVGEMLLPIWKWIERNLPAVAANYVKYIRLFVETFLATLIIVVTVVACRAFFRAKHTQLINNKLVTYVSNFFYSIFSPASRFFVGASEWILKYILNVKLTESHDLVSKVDLEHFIQQTGGNPDDDNSDLNKEMFENALSLSDVKLRDCLVPRKEIVGIEKNGSIESIKKLFIESRLSKLVVYEENIDNIAGYVHQLDLFKNPSTIAQIILPIPVVPESMSATDLMSKFSKERKTIAWVIDEYGGTAGIVTMEDLLEEIFGEIKDEYDEVDEFVDKQLSSTEFIFSGRLELDYISEKYGIEFPDNDDSETLSGYIIQRNEAIPRQKERIITSNFLFEVINVSDTRIETVKLKVLK